LFVGTVSVLSDFYYVLVHLGSEYEVTSVFKPSAPLANVIEDLENLSKDLTKKDYIIIVGGQKTA
jgi:hypothetical protein